MEKQTASDNRRKPDFQWLFIVGMLLVLIALWGLSLVFCGWVFLQRMERLYRGHIYPNIYALNINVGALTIDEATRALESGVATLPEGELTLTDGDRHWAYPWGAAGMRLDARATAQAAYAIGREAGSASPLHIWLAYVDVSPRFSLDANVARSLLESVSVEASTPTVEPTLRLVNGQVEVVAGKPGRMLNVTNTLVRLQNASSNETTSGFDQVTVALEFADVQPLQPDVASVTQQAEGLLAHTVAVNAADVLTGETLTWTLGRDISVNWLRLTAGPEGKPLVDANLYAIQATLLELSRALGDGRGFRYEEAARQIYDAFNAGEPNVVAYLTHPVRHHEVAYKETATSIAAQYGMPPGLVIEANSGVNLDQLKVGQVITVPSQDILTPYLPVAGKKIVINIAEQRMRVYENEALLYDWLVSTGISSSPTHRGVFQVLDKNELSYASQWDLQMPYFISIYRAGGNVDNGIHELPILSNGQRLWAGTLGKPASFGCIILGIPEAETLYAWADIGVLVIIE